MKRIVIKIGSNVLTRPDGTLDVTRISSLVDQVQAVRADGAQVLLVSSGAVACGRSNWTPSSSASCFPRWARCGSSACTAACSRIGTRPSGRCSR